MTREQDIAERLEQYAKHTIRLCEQIMQLRAEIERLRAALGEIAGNKTNSRAWLEDRARRALEPKP